MSEQFSFLTCRWPRAKAPKRVQTLEVLEKVIPWSEFEAAIRPHYFADTRPTGRRGCSLRMLLRCHVIGRVWQLTDEGVEAAILDSLAIAKFVGCDPWSPRPPSASTLREFRHLVNRLPSLHGLDGDIAIAFAGAGLQFRPGKILEPVFRRMPK